MALTQPAGLHPARGYLPFIDGLRAIAVLGVLCFHFNLGPVQGGYVGVDVFFVISGYLISGLIQQRLRLGTFSFAEFYERRARRILPPLLVTCALSSIAALILLVPHDLREFGKSLKGAIFFFANVVFAQATGYFADPVSTRPLLHTWSLAVEEQFYFLLPPLLYVMHRGAGKARSTSLLCIALLCVLSFALSVLLVQRNPERAFYLLPARGWELLLGSVVALWPRLTVLPRPLAEAGAWLGAAAIAVAYMMYDRSTRFPGVAALLPCLGAAVLIAANVAQPTRLGRLLASRSLVAVGLVSYGLYLYHWPVIAFARYALDREMHPLEACAALALIAVLSVLSYRCIETPVRTGTVLAGRRQVFGAAAGGLITLGGLGIVMVNADGFPQRFSGAALQYAAGKRDTWDWARCMPPVDRIDASSVCKLGPDGAQPQFLVWGDSHADALMPGIDAAAKRFGTPGWFVAYSRCPALLHAAPVRRAVDDHPCERIGDSVLALIRTNRLRKVLLVSRWDSYIDGWERGGSETLQDLTLGYSRAGSEPLVGLPAFRAAFVGTIRELRALGVDVWVFEQVPPQLIDVPSALAKAIHFGRDPLELRRAFAAVEARRSAANEVIELGEATPGVATPGISIIDPAGKFCPDGDPCAIAAEGRALYSDGNHLSVYGARWSQSVLDGFFNSTAPSISRP